jgi:hypothetical protein
MRAFLVNRLQTISIKVNTPPSAESQLNNGVIEMKKTKAGRGFWSWLMGSGWSATGSGG